MANSTQVKNCRVEFRTWLEIEVPEDFTVEDMKRALVVAQPDLVVGGCLESSPIREFLSEVGPFRIREILDIRFME